MTPPTPAEIARTLAGCIDIEFAAEERAALLHCAACAEALERAGSVEEALDAFGRVALMYHRGTDEHNAARLALVAAIAKAGEEEREAILQNDQPWPLADVLTKLSAAAEHLLTVHACDAGEPLFYEEVGRAMRRALEIAAAIRTRGRKP